MSTEHPGAERLRPTDPDTIGPYRLLGRLGEGGMGTVYLALAPTGRAVAVKVVKPEFAVVDGFTARFHAEVDNARRVASFCTAQVLDNGNDDSGLPYMVTEYIAGTPLSRQISQYGALEPGPLHGVALGVAAALAAIHVAGLVHRDLKPANVILSMSGPRVIDFGISRALDRTQGFTMSGELIGSPGWWAPEQVRGLEITPAADVFAWGCLVAYAGNGRHPFGRGDAITMASRVLHSAPDLGALPAPLNELARAATAMDPYQRPTAQDLLLALVGGGIPTPTRPADPAPENPPTLIATDLLAESWQPPANVAPDATQTLSALGVPETTAAPPETATPAPTPAPAPVSERDESEITQPGLRAPTGPSVLPPRPDDTGPGNGTAPPSTQEDVQGRLVEQALAASARPAETTPAPGTTDGRQPAPPSTVPPSTVPPSTVPPSTVPPSTVPPSTPQAPVTPVAAPAPPPGKGGAGRRWLIAALAVVAALVVTAVVLVSINSGTGGRVTPTSGGQGDGDAVTDIGRRIPTGSYIEDPQLIVSAAPACGLGEYQGATPSRGQFCTVRWTMLNPGGELVALSRTPLSAVDDRGARQAAHTSSTPLPAALAPGAKVDGVLVFDLPPGRKPARLVGKVIEGGPDIEVRLS
ncbi:serine/threonine protein kinase [Thermocatellispora tengchongensis]|uniref:Serine/threonine protein kinase n=1 Tax=Thermocatellispora tengchongensis TaxID=1073253 RepID=A0A840PDN5_9ACTN|nr:serine/threonine-protein kinase [Thermocatellispora tengchongensis]MBB5134155.1 serine/threonine protein kinase [Thermocatellispora tengchongensis]